MLGETEVIVRGPVDKPAAVELDADAVNSVDRRGGAEEPAGVQIA
jgi:hypothetical protein